MIIHMLSTKFLLLMVIIFMAAYFVYRWYTYWQRRKIPWSRYPYLGLTRLRDDLYCDFSDFYYCGYFEYLTPVLFLRDPDLIQCVCVKNFDCFIDHEVCLSEEMDPVAGRNLFSMTGEQWREARRIISPTFTAMKMKFLFQLIKDASNDFTRYLIDHPENIRQCKLKSMATRFAVNIIATSIYGINVDSIRNLDDEFYYHAEVAAHVESQRHFKLMMLSKLPKLMRLFGFTLFPRKTDRFFKGLITNIFRLRQKEGIIRDDLIHLMFNEMEKDGGVNITFNDIMGQLFLSLVVGFHSISNFICFLFTEIAAHPHIQEKMFQEIQSRSDQGNCGITHDSLSRMTYMDKVLRETLRLHPLFPTINRICVKDCKLPGLMKSSQDYRIERGTLIIIPIFSIHHDPKYFSDPEKFIPERDEFQKTTNIYMPFGVGPRKCIGDRFVLMVTKVLLAHILENFIIKVNDKTVYPIIYSKNAVTLKSDDEFWLTLERRLK